MQARERNGRFVERRWDGDPGAYGSRHARASFLYQAWVPNPIAEFQPTITFEVAETIHAAEDAISGLNASADVMGLEAIGPLLLRSEAIASSKIEGYELSQRNLARALIDPRAAKATAKVVAANVVAMEAAIELGEAAKPFTLADLCQIHRLLMAGEPERSRPGALRQEQNWIGGRLNSPIDARYIPPPESDVPPLVEDLLRFVSERDDLPPVAQAAIAHAQFETIHPFVDGNGRLGRCLIHVVLRRRGIAERFVPPISVVLAARPELYVDGLVGYREGRAAAWCGSFAAACQRAALLSIELADNVVRLQQRWRRAASVRRDSAAARIIDILPAQPIVSAATMRAAVSVSHQRALVALKDLEAASVVRQITDSGYDRQYAADDLFDLIEAFETEVSNASTSSHVLSRVDREAELLSLWGRLEHAWALARTGPGSAPDDGKARATPAEVQAAQRWYARNGAELRQLAGTVRMLRATPNAMVVSDPHLQDSLTTARVLEESYLADVDHTARTNPDREP